MNKQELSKALNVSINTINTNFPKLCASQAKKGVLIVRTGVGYNTNYELQTIEPQEISKNQFARQKNEIIDTDLEGEVWVDTYCSNLHEVSNYGRIRQKNTKRLIKGHQEKKDGYIRVGILNKQEIAAHRIVLQSFDPQPNFEELTVDHINGKRNDNRLENLRWMSNEENTLLMINHRKDLNKELTRIIQIYGYEKTLNLLKNIT